MTESSFSLTEAGCAERQRRLREVMERAGWDVFVTASWHSVYYFTGLLLSAETPVVLAVFAGGPSVLVGPAKGEGLVDENVVVESYSIARVIEFAERDVAEAWARFVAGRRVRRAGCEMRAMPASLLIAGAEVEDATEAVLRLRRRKEPDEIAAICYSLDLIRVAYDTARRVIAPGLREVDVYAEMHASIVRRAGTAVAFPGDFACGERCVRGGGPATERVIQAGDLYILDLFPAPALYFGDTCRAFAVTEPTVAQLRAWKVVCEAVEMAERAIRPGVAVRAVYQQVKDFLDGADAERSFWHHLGHGIGHRGHEAPRIIPGSEEVFEEGDVITLEPGVYGTALGGGIRLEDNYVVTADGLTNLFEYPREIVR